MVLTLGLSSPVHDHDQDQPEEEGRLRGDGHGEMACRNHAAADEHRLSLPPQVVSDPAPRESQQIDHPVVEPVDRAGRRDLDPHPGIVASDSGSHEQDQQGPHPVIAGPLPHLGEEERRKTARMAEEGCPPEGLSDARRRGGSALHGKTSQ